jgi:hypothetical protein
MVQIAESDWKPHVITIGRFILFWDKKNAADVINIGREKIRTAAGARIRRREE